MVVGQRDTGARRGWAMMARLTKAPKAACRDVRRWRTPRHRIRVDVAARRAGVRTARTHSTAGAARSAPTPHTPPSPASCSGFTVAPVCCAVTNANTSAAVTCPGGLPTTAKNTLRSYAAASTVFGRERTAKNSRYTSSCGPPSRTIRSPAAFRERCGHGSTQVMRAPFQVRGLPAYQAKSDPRSRALRGKSGRFSTAEPRRATSSDHRSCAQRPTRPSS